MYLILIQFIMRCTSSDVYTVPCARSIVFRRDSPSGLGRGATGFTTRSDIGPARMAAPTVCPKSAAPQWVYYELLHAEVCMFLFLLAVAAIVWAWTPFQRERLYFCVRNLVKDIRASPYVRMLITG